MTMWQAPCVYGSFSPPIPIRRHHHLAHEAVLDAELGVYLYRWPLLDGWAAGRRAGPFDALYVVL